MTRLDILFPPGRIVGGSLYKPRETDAEGKPLIFKRGAKANQPRVDFYFATAIPKRPGEQHWGQTEWGGKIAQFGMAAFPTAYQAGTIAWKIKDGDSTQPNRRGKRPCDQPGHPGHWIVSFGGGYKPRVFNADGSQQILEDGAVKPGFWVQVFGNIESNDSPNQPGLYINHSMVSFQAYGQEIIMGPDAGAVGFGQGVQLPPGASATPLGQASVPAQMPGAGGFPPPGGAQMPPGMPMPGAGGFPPPGGAQMPGVGAFPPPGAQMPGAGGFQPPGTVGMGMPGLPQPGMAQMPGVMPTPGGMPGQPTYVQPNTAFLMPGQPQPGMPTGMPPPGMPTGMPQPAARQMTAAAQGQSYQALIGAGWTDATLIQHGLMLP